MFVRFSPSVIVALAYLAATLDQHPLGIIGLAIVLLIGRLVTRK